MKKQTLSKGFAVLTVGVLTVKILSVIYIIFLTSILGKDGFGVYSAVYIVYVFIYVITNSGLSIAAAKIFSELIAQKRYVDVRKTFKILFSLMFTIGLVMTSIMCFFAEDLSKIVNFPKAAFAIQVLSPAVFLTSIISVFRGYFQGRGSMTPITISQILEQIINIILSLTFAAILIDYGVEEGCAGATIGTSIGALSAILYLLAIYKKNNNLEDIDGKPAVILPGFSTGILFRKILNYCIPITLCFGMQNAGSLVDMANVKSRLLVSGFSDSVGNSLFAILGQFNTLINVPITVISALTMALLPAISTSHTLENEDEMKSKILYSFKVCFLISIPSTVIYAVLAEQIYKMFYPSMSEGYVFMQNGSIIVVMWSVVLIQATILQGLGRLFISMAFSFLAIILKVTINYNMVAIKEINIYGALAGNISYFLIPLVLNQLFLRKSLKFSIPLYKIASKPLISSIIMGISLVPIQYILSKFFATNFKDYYANAFTTISTITIGGVVYVFLLALTKGLTYEDLRFIPLPVVRRVMTKLIGRN